MHEDKMRSLPRWGFLASLVSNPDFCVLHFNITTILARKRFYKNVSLVNAGKENFEITLDSNKLKTPGGTLFTVASEPLALAVAHEWNSQKELVLLSQMHLTGKLVAHILHIFMRRALRPCYGSIAINLQIFLYLLRTL